VPLSGWGRKKRKPPAPNGERNQTPPGTENVQGGGKGKKTFFKRTIANLPKGPPPDPKRVHPGPPERTGGGGDLFPVRFRVFPRPLGQVPPGVHRFNAIKVKGKKRPIPLTFTKGTHPELLTPILNSPLQSGGKRVPKKTEPNLRENPPKQKPTPSPQSLDRGVEGLLGGNFYPFIGKRAQKNTRFRKEIPAPFVVLNKEGNPEKTPPPAPPPWLPRGP